MAHVCKTCSKSFTQLRSLTRHEKSTHGTNKFVCEQCNELFTRRDALKRHERKHVDTTTYACGNCSKEFYRRDKFAEHQIFCETKTLKRKSEKDDDISTPKKRTVDVQTGAGEMEKEDDSCNLTSAFKDSLKKVGFKPRKEQKHDMSQFLRGKTKSILGQTKQNQSKELKEKKGLKWFISVKARFVKPKPNGEDLVVEPHFRSLCMTTVNPHELERQLQEANQKVKDSLAIYQKEGSGWVLNEILHMDLNMAQYTPLKGLSYIPLPKKLNTKKGVVNIKNSDNKCFMWSVLAGLHPIRWKNKPERLHHHQRYQNELSFQLP